ncbi:MAG: alpha-hydroxy-acid oxidizing protein [Proteobacteria bacterium]|nr:alpha-hydroxy-acid oxidizing protein [Pseudomonadota bacterium]MBI3498050.1 alpha-hydroxy-acid oxidizing protein [Pseudomonadota bacterium]
MTKLRRTFNIEDLRQAAKRRLPRGIFEYVDRGTEDETGLEENRAAFERIRFKPRVLLDMSTRRMETTLFGRQQRLPFVIAPMSPTGFLWYEGELMLARAAAAAGIPYSFPTYSFTAMEKIAAATPGNLWFQLYMWQDQEHSLALLERAKEAGSHALIVTVDTSVGPNREFNQRNGMTEPFRPALRPILGMLAHPGWLMRVLLPYVLAKGAPMLENHPTEHRLGVFRKPPNDGIRISASLNWADIRKLKEFWKGPLVIKGILRADDAKRAIDAGADGVVVSNHGARNLDGAIASIDALPEIADAVRGRLTLLLDSGIRRGSDVAKALALGADAVLIGRAALWGLAVAGQKGVEHALALLGNELDITMAFLGCRELAELGPDLLALPARPALTRSMEPV